MCSSARTSNLCIAKSNNDVFRLHLIPRKCLHMLEHTHLYMQAHACTKKNTHKRTETHEKWANIVSVVLWRWDWPSHHHGKGNYYLTRSLHPAAEAIQHMQRNYVYKTTSGPDTLGRLGCMRLILKDGTIEGGWYGAASDWYDASGWYDESSGVLLGEYGLPVMNCSITCQGVRWWKYLISSICLIGNYSADKTWLHTLQTTKNIAVLQSRAFLVSHQRPRFPKTSISKLHEAFWP